jgi:hypothetical protein
MRLNLGLDKLFNVVSGDLDGLRVEFAMQFRLFRGIEFALGSLQAVVSEQILGLSRLC